MCRKLNSRIKKFIFYKASRGSSPRLRNDVDVREEYANAFRTESYNQFWTRLMALSHKDSATCLPLESTASSRLSSYRLFAENLLDPVQPTVTQILEITQIRPKIRILLSNYFSETANTSLLFSLLLKDIDHTRFKYNSLKTLTQSFESVSELNFPGLMNRLIELTRFVNPFVQSASSPSRVRVIQKNCSNLLKRLESIRDKARVKIRFISRLKNSSGVLLVTLTASLTAILTTHAFALLVAAPCLFAAWLQPGSTKKLVAQLDMAAKGAYILSRDLDTISRLVARLNDELEHLGAMVRFWVERGEDRVRASVEEVRRQLKRSDESFSEQLDELEEHLYLCFMTINRARNLVVKEILDPGKPDCPLGPKSK